MKREKKKPFADDGRVIAPMNVEGMPWHAPGEAHAPTEEKEDSLPLSRGETLHVILGGLKAALVITGVVAAVLILFTLFCTKVWLA